MGNSRIAFSATAMPVSNFTKMIFRRQTLSGLCRLAQLDRMLAVLLARYSTPEDPERCQRIGRVRRGKAFCEGDGWRRFTFYTKRNHDCKTKSSDKFEGGYSKGEDSMRVTVTVQTSSKQANGKRQNSNSPKILHFQAHHCTHRRRHRQAGIERPRIWATPEGKAHPRCALLPVTSFRER